MKFTYRHLFHNYNYKLLHNIMIILHSSALCTDGEVRVVEGETEWEGRLEVCLSQRWGTVSSDGWSHTNTRVICSDLGYETISGNNYDLVEQ